MTRDALESSGSGTIGLSRHEDLYVPSEHGPAITSRTSAAAAMAAGTLLVFWPEMSSGSTLEYARTAALTTMVLFQTFHLGSTRSERRSVFCAVPNEPRA